MTQAGTPLSSTLRQRRATKWAYMAAIWLVLTGLTTLAGPFGTYDLLPLAPRFAYWAVVVAISIALNFALMQVVGVELGGKRMLGRLVYAVVLAALIHGINRIVFAEWGGWSDLAWLAFVVMAVGVTVEGAVLYLRSGTGTASQPDPTDPTEVFLRRVPLDKRGALIRLEAQDHYLNVVTTAGAALILMRMADAEAELGGAHGMRVHRSHWVAIDRVIGHRRRDGRDFLVTSDEGEVPVSRSFRPAVKAAGLIAG